MPRRISICSGQVCSFRNTISLSNSPAVEASCLTLSNSASSNSLNRAPKARFRPKSRAAVTPRRLWSCWPPMAHKLQHVGPWDSPAGRVRINLRHPIGAGVGPEPGSRSDLHSASASPPPIASSRLRVRKLDITLNNDLSLVVGGREQLEQRCRDQLGRPGTGVPGIAL